ncbi:MAG: helix-turn-helix domain-containing protein [Lachnospiraceae bacterium]|nr:helix-turn-helix domain-containing protein [Lachnospiraceae bacterium]MDE7273173.1 helix-turn-helix domain-containing protein [Lachnospiraceae bacterium]
MIENLPNKLKSARIQNNLSRKQVSEKIKISVSMIGLYESGERTPSLTIITKLAAFYKVSLDYLLGIETDNRKYLSLEGLTNKQIDALKLTVECFRNLNH